MPPYALRYASGIMITMNARTFVISFCTFASWMSYAVCAPALTASNRQSYFEANASRSEDLSMFPKWTGVTSRTSDQDKIPDNECDRVQYHPCALKQWKAMLTSIHEKSLREQLTLVNSWANSHPYIIDQINWGMEDYWETPYEFMAVSGDCEDYAIAKYYSLRALGVPEDKLRVIIVQDFNLGGIIHAVLGVYDGNELLILDNQIKQVMPALKIYHYRPIYSINENWWWVYAPN